MNRIKTDSSFFALADLTPILLGTHTHYSIIYNHYFSTNFYGASVSSNFKIIGFH